MKNIDIDMASLENIDIDIDKDILENIDIDMIRECCKISISIKYCIDKDLAYRTPLAVSDLGI